MNFILLIAGVFFSTIACANNVSVSIPNNQKLKEECGSCHVVFPPQLMTDENWRQLMNGLDKHFGETATLDPKDYQEILGVLVSNAGTKWGRVNSESGMRLIDTAWFSHKHANIPNKFWFDDAVKSPSNCIACHIKADKGDWSEESTQTPMPIGHTSKLN